MQCEQKASEARQTGFEHTVAARSTSFWQAGHLYVFDMQ
jgi:hypothetical protein